MVSVCGSNSLIAEQLNGWNRLTVRCALELNEEETKALLVWGRDAGDLDAHSVLCDMPDGTFEIEGSHWVIESEGEDRSGRLRLSSANEHSAQADHRHSSLKRRSSICSVDTHGMPRGHQNTLMAA